MSGPGPLVGAPGGHAMADSKLRPSSGPASSPAGPHPMSHVSPGMAPPAELHQQDPTQRLDKAEHEAQVCPDHYQDEPQLSTRGAATPSGAPVANTTHHKEPAGPPSTSLPPRPSSAVFPSESSPVRPLSAGQGSKPN